MTHEVENTKGIEITPERILDSAIAKYNSRVSDIFKFKLDSGERKMFANLMREYHTKQLEQLTERGFMVPKGEEVNAFLSASLRLLNQEQLICLRDSLIERTPKDEKAMEQYHREKAKEGNDIAESLAQWSMKYPRDRIYGGSNHEMDGELIAIEERAKSWLKSKLTEEKPSANSEINELRQEEIYCNHLDTFINIMGQIQCVNCKQII